MTFKNAVETCTALSGEYQNGLSALGKYSGKIRAQDNSKIDGSVDIDTALKEKYPNDNRWDYAVGYDGKAYFIEVHPADSGQVSVMKKKLAWLKNMLNFELHELDNIKAAKPYYWVYTNRVNIPKQTPQYRAAVSMGLYPVREVVLK